MRPPFPNSSILQGSECRLTLIVSHDILVQKARGTPVFALFSHFFAWDSQAAEQLVPDVQVRDIIARHVGKWELVHVIPLAR